jgi:hypothetical protein
MSNGNKFLKVISPYMDLPDFKPDFFEIARTCVDVWEGDAPDEDVRQMREVMDHLELAGYILPKSKHRVYVTVNYLTPVFIANNCSKELVDYAFSFRVDNFPFEYSENAYRQRENAAMIWCFEGQPYEIGHLTTCALAYTLIEFAPYNLVNAVPSLRSGQDGQPAPGVIVPFPKRR